MKRSIEALFILMISVVTVGTTATFVHDANHGSPDALSRLASQGFHRFSSWWHGRPLKQHVVKNAVPVLQQSGLNGLQEMPTIEKTPNQPLSRDTVAP